MKKILAGLTALTFALSVLTAAPANAGFEWDAIRPTMTALDGMDDYGDLVPPPGPSVCSPVTKQWFSIDNNDIQLDSRRWVRNRVAWRVSFCGSDPYAIQTYLAVSCKLDGNPYPCSFGWSVIGTHIGDPAYENRTNVNPNTGSDGTASTYGPSHYLTAGDCKWHHMTGVIRDVGIAGRVFDMSNANNPDDYNACV